VKALHAVSAEPAAHAPAQRVKAPCLWLDVLVRGAWHSRLHRAGVALRALLDHFEQLSGDDRLVCGLGAPHPLGAGADLRAAGALVVACPGIIGQQEAKWLARKHVLVDRVNLVWQRFEARGLHGEKRVEQPCELDPPGLRSEPEKLAVAVEGPRARGGNGLETDLVVAEEHLLGDPTALVPERGRQRTRPVSAGLDDRDRAVSGESDDLASWREFLEFEPQIYFLLSTGDSPAGRVTGLRTCSGQAHRPSA
jgi:hypothetical protein